MRISGLIRARRSQIFQPVTPTRLQPAILWNGVVSHRSGVAMATNPGYPGQLKATYNHRVPTLHSSKITPSKQIYVIQQVRLIHRSHFNHDLWPRHSNWQKDRWTYKFLDHKRFQHVTQVEYSRHPIFAKMQIYTRH